jgi:hypothetical protein
MAVDDNGVWIMNFHQGTVTRIDPTDLSVGNPIRVGKTSRHALGCMDGERRRPYDLSD